MPSVGPFLKSNFYIIQGTILTAVLLLFEKLMDLEFKCPGNRSCRFWYSLAFLLIPTIIIAFLSCPCLCFKTCCQCCKSEDNTANAANSTNTTSTAVTVNMELTENQNSSKSKCEKCKKWAKYVVITLFWICIVVTDGRYISCLVESWQGIRNMKTSTVEDNYIIMICQVTGLALVLILVFCVKCCCGERLEIIWEESTNTKSPVNVNVVQAKAKNNQEEFTNDIDSILNEESLLFQLSVMQDPQQPNNKEMIESETKYKSTGSTQRPVEMA